MPATILRRAMALQSEHVRRGLPTPTDDARIRLALRSLAAGKLPKDLLGDTKELPEPKRSSKAAPMTRALLNRIFDAMGGDSLDRRDRALLLLGFVGGLKRGTLCGLDLSDLTFTEDAMLVRIRAGGSKAEEKPARTIAVPMTRGPLCAATAVLQWISHNALEGASGPIFCRFARSGEPILTERLDSAYVSKIIKIRLLDTGITDVTAFSGESLRLGNALETNTRRRS
jgi:integrase